MDDRLASMRPNVSDVAELIRWRALRHPDRVSFAFLDKGELLGETATFGELLARSQSVATLLRERLQPGDRALLLYPQGLDFVYGFLGCLMSGVIAVPAFPPRPSEHVRRLRLIAKDCAASAILTNARLRGAIAKRCAEDELLATLPLVVSDDCEASRSTRTMPRIEATSIAFLQYTSGSTGSPKGVMISHQNILENEASIASLFDLHEASRGVGWLPLYHDMGLLGHVLQPLYSGMTSWLMSPIDFVQKPVRWLRAISRFGATISGGPNFAYELCLDRIRDADLVGLDLGTWDCAYCGAEPIRPETLQRFAARFGGVGFRATSLQPCYGLAEGTLLVAGSAKGRGLVTEDIGLERALSTRVQAAGDDTATQSVASCGWSPAGAQVAVVDPVQETRCKDHEIGEIWISGKHVAAGYWGEPAPKNRRFHARLAEQASPTSDADMVFMRTGDLGYISHRGLFVIGRLDDLIVIRGRNVCPQDLEWAAGAAHPALAGGLGAAFAAQLEHGDRLVIVHEARTRPAFEPDAVQAAVRGAIADLYGLAVDTIVLVQRGAIPRTSSGKVQRKQCRAAWLEGALRAHALPYGKPQTETEAPS